jgi:hypothetical protein
VWITTRQLAKCEKKSELVSKNTNVLASLASVFSPFTEPFCIFGFSDLASENTEFLAS